jgi:hypothetical protein
MKNTFLSLKFTLCCLSFCYNVSIQALNSADIEQQANLVIKELYHTLNNMPNTSMSNRIDWISERFKGAPYLLGSLGEGIKGRYDQFPNYRTDAFDCDTYVNTVIALALANSLEHFQQCINWTRYKNGKVSYLNRNHFTSIDWNKNNHQQGVIQDITLTVQDQHHRPVAHYAQALINKPNWYAHKTLATIRLNEPTKDIESERLAELKIKGSAQPATPSIMPYLPLDRLFNKRNEANHYLFNQIPSGTIVEIVRPNWDLKEAIGTSLNVSHLGFAIWKNNILYFREASSQYGKVVDVSLIEYLKEALKSPSIKGINLQAMMPKEGGANTCHSKHLLEHQSNAPKSVLKSNVDLSWAK